jgi:RNA polymerase sigma-70 factor (ECF subfamily)
MAAGGVMVGLDRDRSDDEADAEAEAALVARAKADRRAFAPLYARYLGSVLRYCQRRIGDRESAEDAASLVFAQAMANIGSCRNDAFRGWLFSIAHNVVIDHYRRSRGNATLDDAPESIDPDPTPEEIALAREERAALWAQLRHLTPDQRRVVELRLAGFTGVEIAGALGLSHGAVKLHQFRAIRRLRAVMGVTLGDADEGRRKG